MACCFAAEIVQGRVADLANSPAMRRDPRLDMNNFEPQINYLRINQRFLRFLFSQYQFVLPVLLVFGLAKRDCNRELQLRK